MSTSPLTRPDGKEWGKLEGQVHGDADGRHRQTGRRRVCLEGSRAKGATLPHRRHTSSSRRSSIASFSGAIAPVLHINPGDTIKTTTVDAGGSDSKGVRRSMGGNPETGPFYVEGAMPGDTLAIQFHRIRLNRDSAGSGDRIVPARSRRLLPQRQVRRQLQQRMEARPRKGRRHAGQTDRAA